MAEAPPPSYESAVGGYSFSNFVDFWPKCLNGELKAKYAVLEEFRVVFDRANRWLNMNSDYSPFSCETIEKKVYKVDDIYNGGLGYISYGSSAERVKGLRLWVTKNLSAYPVQLGYIDILPHRLHCHAERYMDFEAFQQVVDRFNSHINSTPVPGRVMSIQTVPVSIANELWTPDFVVDPDRSFWPDSYKNHKYYFLRVFYQQGEPCADRIGLADFLPDQIDDTSFFGHKPRYMPMSQVVEKATRWVSTATGIRVTNIQTLDTMYCSASDSPSRLDSQCSMQYKVEKRCRVLFTRVAYVTSIRAPSAPLIGSKTIYPGNYDGRIETAEQLQIRLWRWLRNKVSMSVMLAGCAVSLICAESVNIPRLLHTKHPEEDRSVYTGEWYDAGSDTSDLRRHDLIQQIRVYVEFKNQTEYNQVRDTEPEPEEEDWDSGCTLL